MWGANPGDQPMHAADGACPHADHIRLPVRHSAVRPRAPAARHPPCSQARQRPSERAGPRAGTLRSSSARSACWRALRLWATPALRSWTARSLMELNLEGEMYLRRLARCCGAIVSTGRRGASARPDRRQSQTVRRPPASACVTRARRLPRRGLPVCRAAAAHQRLAAAARSAAIHDPRQGGRVQRGAPHRPPRAGPVSAGPRMLAPSRRAGGRRISALGAAKTAKRMYAERQLPHSSLAADAERERCMGRTHLRTSRRPSARRAATWTPRRRPLLRRRRPLPPTMPASAAKAWRARAERRSAALMPTERA